MSVYGSEGEPRTIVVPIDSVQTARYMLPPGIAQYVQSVLVNVDASGGPETRPTLRILEQSGVVIAAKRQGEAIPAGDTGTATWALRLTDESTATPTGSGDYVKLASVVVAADGDPIQFLSIPQTYSHLVVELLGAATGIVGDEIPLNVKWNAATGYGYGFTEAWWWGAHAAGQDFSFDTTLNSISVGYVLPNAGNTPAGQLASVTLKFPYYSVNGVQKNVLWQSGGQDTINDVTNVLTTIGAGTRQIDGGADGGLPIADLYFGASDIADWVAGSRATLYGIR